MLLKENRNLKSAMIEMFPDFEKIYFTSEHINLIGASTYYLVERKYGYYLLVTRNYTLTKEIINEINNDDYAELFIRKTGAYAVKNARLSTLVRIIRESEKRLAA